MTLVIGIGALVLQCMLFTTLPSGAHAINEATLKDLPDLVQMDIKMDRDNIFEECKYDSYCWFLGQKNLPFLKSDHSVCSNKTGFCMRLNIKPKDASCKEFEFELAAFNVQLNSWMALGLKQRANTMVSTMAINCRQGRSIIFGHIEDRNTRPFVADSKGWPRSTVDSHSKRKPVYDNDPLPRFLRCRFTLPSIIAIKDETVNIGLGDTYILLAHGHKKIITTDNLLGPDAVTGDKHEEKSKTAKKLSETSSWVKCGPETSGGELKVMLSVKAFIGLLLLTAFMP